MPVVPTIPRTGAHGPLLVSHPEIDLEDLAGRAIAVPGRLTSAFLALRLALGEFKYRVMGFDEILPAVAGRSIDAGLIIHEGQLTYGQLGLHCLLDLGQWWFEQTHLPLPLVCNLIRRDLGCDAMRQISSILKASIRYGLTHRAEAVRYALQFGPGLDAATADRFVAMYVNEWTLDYGPLGRKAIREFLDQGAKAQLLPPLRPLEFV